MRLLSVVTSPCNLISLLAWFRLHAGLNYPWVLSLFDSNCREVTDAYEIWQHLLTDFDGDGWLGIRLC